MPLLILLVLLFVGYVIVATIFQALRTLYQEIILPVGHFAFDAGTFIFGLGALVVGLIGALLLIAKLLRRAWSGGDFFAALFGLAVGTIFFFDLLPWWQSAIPADWLPVDHTTKAAYVAAWSAFFMFIAANWSNITSAGENIFEDGPGGYGSGNVLNGQSHATMISHEPARRALAAPSYDDEELQSAFDVPPQRSAACMKAQDEWEHCPAYRRIAGVE